MGTPTDLLQALVAALASISLLMAFLILHKVRKMHIAMFTLLEDAAATRNGTTALFSQLQALFALEKKLGLTEPLPPLRGWAGSPDFLLTVADTVLTRKPGIVVECSSGSSTLVIARCLQLLGKGHVFSLEHDETFGNETTDLLKLHNVTEWATVLHAPLVKQGNDTVWYNENVLPDQLGPIDLLVVDGPPADIAPLARLPALPKLLPLLAKKAVVVLDDAARTAEIEIVRRWLEDAPEFRYRYLHHEKGCVILERP